MVGGALRDGYDPIEQAVSELAALGTPNRLVVTSGMVAFGLAAPLFAGGIRRQGARRTAFALTMAGITSLGVAAFPCTEGCSGAGTTFTDTAHTVVAGSHYVAFTAAPLLAALDENATPLRRRFSLGVAIAAGLALGAQAAGLGPNGLMQRIGLTTNDVWMIVTAAGLSRKAR